MNMIHNKLAPGVSIIIIIIIIIIILIFHIIESVNSLFFF